MSNKNLANAKKAKNDEFYTQKWDIEQELSHYRDSLRGKTIFCNCDDPISSRFWCYFYRQFGFDQLKELISTHYNVDGSPSYALIYRGGSDSSRNYMDNVEKIPLKGDGDFRSDECIEFLKQSDVVVTNPPFSLAREFIAQLVKYNKKFLIIGNKNWITYKEIFPLLVEHKMWLGIGQPKEFNTPNGKTKKVAGLTRWFTNMPVQRPTDQVVVFEDWNFVQHPMYSNYPAFEVSKVSDIPIPLERTVEVKSNMLPLCKKVYKEDLTILSDDGTTAKINIKRPILGVPITFMDKYNPSSIIERHNLGKEFDIIGCGNYQGKYGSDYLGIGKIGEKWMENYRSNGGRGHYTANMHSPVYYTNDDKAKSTYFRIFIRVKPGVTEF